MSLLVLFFCFVGRTLFGSQLEPLTAGQRNQMGHNVSSGGIPTQPEQKYVFPQPGSSFSFGFFGRKSLGTLSVLIFSPCI